MKTTALFLENPKSLVLLHIYYYINIMIEVTCLGPFMGGKEFEKCALHRVPSGGEFYI